MNQAEEHQLHQWQVQTNILEQSLKLIIAPGGRFDFGWQENLEGSGGH